jgi:hypothetical protein
MMPPSEPAAIYHLDHLQHRLNRGLQATHHRGANGCAPTHRLAPGALRPGHADSAATAYGGVSEGLRIGAHTDILISASEGSSAMSTPPGNVEPGAGRFRTPTRPDRTGPTQQLTNIRQKLDQRTRGQRTRRTVDLSPAAHRALDIWQREAADRLGLARVTGQEVLTALIDQLLTDPKLSAQVIRSIQARR